MMLIKRNQKFHNLDSSLLIGDVNGGDVVKKLMNLAILIHKLGYSNNCFLNPSFAFIIVFSSYNSLLLSKVNSTKS